MTKKILVVGALFALCVHTPVLAQSMSRPIALPRTTGTLKQALVDYLYQYGKEVYYRGLDPQEASFALQRALVLDCSHQGAQTFLNKIHSKYPNVSIRIAGCPDRTASVPTEEKAPLRAARTAVTGMLPDENAKARALNREVSAAEKRIDQPAVEPMNNESAPPVHDDDLQSMETPAPVVPAQDTYATALSNDQKDLIRIQQSNIDYLKNELAEARRTGAPSPDAYAKTQIDLASSGLDAAEQKMSAQAKDEEAQDLRARLNELQEQLALVQKIVDDKNRTIESLEKELKPAAPTGK